MSTAVSRMSMPIFWIALLGLTGLSIAMTMHPPREAMDVLVTALLWLGAIALGWLRWIRSGGRFLTRGATGLITAMLIWTAYDWSVRTDVFMCGCKKTEPATFWPLVFLWAAALGFAATTVSLSFKSFIALFKPFSPRSAAWWLFTAAWTGLCILVLVRNVTQAILLKSFTSAGFVLGVIAALAVAGYLLGMPFRLRAKKLKAELALIDEAARRDVIGMVDRYARQGEFLLCYTGAESPDGTDDPAEPRTLARIGGDPLTLPGEQWPADQEDRPAIFLLQLPLLSSRLPAMWQGRLISVYLRDYELAVRSYAPGELARLQPMPNANIGPAVEPMRLRAIALPYVAPAEHNDEEEEDYAFPGVEAEELVERIPELKTRLAPYTTHFELALSWILSGSRRDYYASLPELGAQVGGNPYYIQSEHDPHCEICGQPMRFLLQFDDSFGPDFLLGDAGLGYVYGCDAHPEHCQGYADCC